MIKTFSVLNALFFKAMLKIKMTILWSENFESPKEFTHLRHKKSCELYTCLDIHTILLINRTLSWLSPSVHYMLFGNITSKSKFSKRTKETIDGGVQWAHKQWESRYYRLFFSCWLFTNFHENCQFFTPKFEKVITCLRKDISWFIL